MTFKSDHDLSIRRMLMSLGRELAKRAETPDPDTSGVDLINRAGDALEQILESNRIGDDDNHNFAIALSNTVDEIVDGVKNNRYIGIPTGITSLDKKLSGLHPSNLIIIAGRPSMGKTSLGTTIAWNAARKNKIVQIFTLEMSKREIITRMICSQKGIRSDKIRSGFASEQDCENLKQAKQEYGDTPIFIHQTRPMSVAKMRNRAKRLKRKHGLDMIVIDYLQLMGESDQRRSDNRVYEIGDITRGLKSLAVELDVPVVVLCQLSRKVEERDDKRPQLSDLRDSGSIEQDADIVITIVRDDYYIEREEPQKPTENSSIVITQNWERWKQKMDDSRGLALISIAKNRHGRIGSVVVHFDADRMSFYDLVSDHHK